MNHITIYTHMKLFPKCHPYWEVDGKKIKNDLVQGTAYTAEGYLLPCCWCDHVHPDGKKQFEAYGFYEPELKVSNVDDIEQEILRSPEWYHFHETLVQNPHAAPLVCKRKCGQDESTL